MAGTRAFGLLTVVAAVLLAGCETKLLPYNQRITVVVQESTKENPVRVTVAVDGQEKFGPTDLAPGAVREVIVHDPSPDSTTKLSPKERHKISWRLHKNARMGKIGNAELTIYSGNQPIKSASSKWVMPLFWTDGALYVQFQQAGAAGATGVRGAPPR